MTRMIIVHVPVTYTCPNFEPQQAQMGVTWAELDPAAITLEFIQDECETTRWVLSRDIFADCLLAEPGGQFGQGDVTLERGLISMFLTLRGTDPDGAPYEAGITFMTKPLLELVQASLMCVPRGEEESSHIAGELEAFLESVLAGE